MAYGKVHETFWDDPRIRALSERGRTFMLYLMTCRHKNRLGCYVLDPNYAAADLKWTAEEVERYIRELRDATRIEYDEEHRVVFVRRFLKHNTLENHKVVTGAIAELDGLPETSLLPNLLAAVEKWSRPHYAKLIEALRNRIAYSIDTVCHTVAPPSPSPSPSSNPSQAVRAEEPAHTPEAPAAAAAAGSEESNGPAVPTAESAEDAVSRIIIAANHGMRSNPKIGESYNPIPTSHGSRQVVLDWLAAGIPTQLILDTVVARARAYQPNDRKPQISTMKYFNSAVRDAFDRAKAALPAESQAAKVKTEYPGSGRAARRSGPVRVDGYDPEEAKAEEARREKQRVAEWAKANPEKAAEIRAAIEEDMRKDARWHGLPAGTIALAAEGEYRRRALELMKQKRERGAA